MNGLALSGFVLRFVCSLVLLASPLAGQTPGIWDDVSLSYESELASYLSTDHCYSSPETFAACLAVIDAVCVDGDCSAALLAERQRIVDEQTRPRLNFTWLQRELKAAIDLAPTTAAAVIAAGHNAYLNKMYDRFTQIIPRHELEKLAGEEVVTMTRDAQQRRVTIRITSFLNEHVCDQVAAFVGQVGADEEIILDLRDNTGGFDAVAACVVDLFLPAGKTILEAEVIESDLSSFIHAEHYNLSTKTAAQTDRPLTVLVNEWTASAAEVVAGALQWHERAILVGTRTYGKGVVQTIVPYIDADPSQEAVDKVVSTHLFKIAGVMPIADKGLTPDAAQILDTEN